MKNNLFKITSVLAVTLIGIVVSCKNDQTKNSVNLSADSNIVKNDTMLLSKVMPKGIITRLPGSDSVVALTLDACESLIPSYFDTTILNYLLLERIPFTLFMTGNFAVRNRETLRMLAGYEWIDIQNHSYHHHLHMESLSDSAVIAEVKSAEDTIFSITGRRTKLFRFPGGNYDTLILNRVEHMGYRVVHWSFESGDPDKKITPQKMIPWVTSKTRPGGILIFHINGRGYATGKALPEIVTHLRNAGYHFAKLNDYTFAE